MKKKINLTKFLKILKKLGQKIIKLDWYFKTGIQTFTNEAKKIFKQIVNRTKNWLNCKGST